MIATKVVDRCLFTYPLNGYMTVISYVYFAHGREARNEES